jgi:hypothetical protein
MRMKVSGGTDVVGFGDANDRNSIGRLSVNKMSESLSEVWSHTEVAKTFAAQDHYGLMFSATF